MGGEPPTPDGHDPVLEDPGAGARDALEAWVTLERGECPICGLEFDERALFRTHLAEVHDLHDDDGTESEFGTVVILPVEASVPPPSPLQEETRQRRQEPPQMGRPVGLLALVVCLLGLLTGVILYTGTQDEPTNEDAAVSGDAASAGDDPAGTPSTTAAAAEPGPASTRAPGASGATAATPGDGATPAPAPSQAPSPTSAPTTLAPASSTTAPGAAFAAPTASDAHITSCTRDRDLWRVTYTWRFSGGTMWKPLTSYTSLGGGSYQHVVVVPRRDDTAITAVSVTDPNGTPHSVPLRPTLSSASC